MISRIIDFFSRHWGLKNKTVVLFTAFTIIPLGIVGYLSYAKSITAFRIFFNNYTEQTTEALNHKINDLFDSAISLLNISTDSKTQIFLNSKDPERLYSASKNMGSLFSNVRRVGQFDQDIYDITILGANGNCVSERYGYFRLQKNFADYETIKEVMADRQGVHFFENPELLHAKPLETNIMCIATSIYHAGTNDLSGAVKIDIRKSAIQALLDSTHLSANSLVTIVNAQGTPVLQHSIGGFSYENIRQIMMADQPSGNTAITIGKEDYQVFFNTLNTVQWKLIVGIPENEIFLPFYHVDNAILIAILLCFLVIILANILVSTSLLRPVTGLKKLMKRASEGDFDIEAVYKGNIEIAELYRSFDIMVKQIKQLLVSSLQEQANYTEIQFKLLQAQINPHFLYNTLDSVVRVAESGKNEEVIDLIMALSHYYKAVLGNSSDIIPLSTVRTHLESYLIIMKKRYHDILDYELHVDERILNASFPKITFQPIIENAIYHGIKNRENGGKIWVDFMLSSEGMVQVTVKDNGIGMTVDQLHRLQKQLESEYTNVSDSFGLKNINERIRLFFGKAYGLEISSQHRVGTTVKVIVPYISYGEGEQHV